MLRLRTALAGFLLPLLSPAAIAQLEHGGQPPSLHRALRGTVPTATLRPVAVRELLEEDAALQGKGPLRFAEVIETDLSLANAGVWEELGRGDRVWRLRVRSGGAKSLAFVFSRFQLPMGGELYVYDDAHRTVRGAYTELENQLDGTFAIRPTRGEAVTLEYFEPARARGLGELAIGLVAHDYRDVIGLLEPQDRSGGGGSGPCEIDVACPLGAGWQDQIDATVHVLSLPHGLMCSGSLLNNTSNDGTILVLSAAHCFGLSNAVFTFNFERPACGSGTAPTTNTLTGATQLVLDDDLDVQLVRLNAPQAPQPFTVFLAGWDRSDVPPASSVVIHHPAGDVKKISLDDDPPGKTGNLWRILDWEQGVTEGGSSGSPMFDPAGRFVGNLDSGSSSCVVPTDDDFCTRLAAAWPLLEPYLDPLGTGQLVLDGLDLDTVAPQPYDVTGVVPAAVEALYPGTLRTVRVLGSGFTDATQLAIDGNPVSIFRFVRGGHAFLNVDMPQLSIGSHVFNVLENGAVETVPFQVVAPAEPRMQAVDGNKGDPVFWQTGVDILHSDAPGHVHYCYWSLSNVPSVHPYLTLALGNNFTQLLACRVNAIPSRGWLNVHHALFRGALPPQTTVWSQSACLNHGLPLHTSNLQESVYQ